MIDTPVVLGIAVVALYLKDSLLLLERDEAVLVADRRGRWRAGFGWREWLLRGREPYLCHPLKPFEPLARLRWDAALTPGATIARAAGVPVGVGPLAAWVMAIWSTTFVVLPIVFYGKLGLPLLCFVVSTLYALIVGGLAYVHSRRDVFGLDGRAFAVLAFEVLACAPYASNLLRRVCLAQRVDEDFLVASHRLLTGERLRAALAGCRLRIGDELEEIEEASPRAVALQAARERLEREEMPDGGR